MEKLNYKQINHQQLIDVRGQLDYQAGHGKESLNLNPGNFKKFATSFVSTDQRIVFIIGEQTQSLIDELQAISQELDYPQIDGYILAEDIPAEGIDQTNTISVEDFLKLNDDYILLDLRNPTEITRPAPEKNLINIPLEDLSSNYHQLDTGKDIYTLCGSGNRATAAASFLTTKGFNSVVVEGGMKAVQEKTE